MTNNQINRFNYLIEEMLAENIKDTEINEYLNLLKLWNIEFEYNRKRTVILAELDGLKKQ